MTYVPSHSETSKSLKINKEEVLRNLRVGESIRCFPIPLFVLVVGLVLGGGRGFVYFLFFRFKLQTYTQPKDFMDILKFQWIADLRATIIWFSHNRNY